MQQLHEFDIEYRFLSPDVLPDFTDDFFDSTFPLIFQLDGEVAGVGFGNGENAQLQAGTARGAFDFRSGANDPLDMVENAIRFLERAACRHDVIQNESTLVEGRKQT